jgi:predicted dienelactone hydrolase
MVLLLLLACAEPTPTPPVEVPWTPPGERGPWEAGVTTIVVADPRGRDLTLEVWYPAVPEPGDAPDAYAEVPLTFDSYRDAPPAREAGPRPLLAFSHGYGGIRFQSATLCEHLARHGYVVVAPDHEGTILVWLDLDEMDRHMLERPDDVRHAVDEVLRRSILGDPLLGGMVDGDRYAVLGHSFGAVTALAVGGAMPDFAQAELACAEVGRDGCGFLPAVDPADVAGHGIVDPRAEAIVAMSPGGWYVFGADGAHLADTAPTLQLSGDADNVLDYAEEQRPLWERLAQPAALATLRGTGHYASFSDMCSLIPVYEDCVGPEAGFMASEVGQAYTELLVTAWLGASWRGDDRDAEALTPEALAALEDVSWEAR